MPQQSDLDRRLRAVERALTEGDNDVATLHDTAELVDRLEAVEDRLTSLEERTAELDAATQAVRGYVGNVRSVNQEVEERAVAALAAVDRIEERLDDLPESSQRQNAVRDPQQHHSSTDRSDRPPGTQSATAESQAEEGYAIEMPPPGSTDAGTQEAGGEDEDEDRSVIERVREAL